MNEKAKVPAAEPALAQAAKKPKSAPAKAVAAKPAPAPQAVAPVPPAKAEKPAKDAKPQKVKLVRDSFTMPETEYARIAELKKKCLLSGVHVKKSELLRAGLLNLARLSDAELLAVTAQVEILKTGRPAKA